MHALEQESDDEHDPIEGVEVEVATGVESETVRAEYLDSTSSITAGTAGLRNSSHEGDDEETTEDNDDSGKVDNTKTAMLHNSYAGVLVTPKRKRRKRYSYSKPGKRRESYKRSKFYLSPDPEKIDDRPQNVYSKRVIKVQVTKTTRMMTETTTMMETHTSNEV